MNPLRYFLVFCTMTVFSSTRCAAQTPDFLPLEIGNRWVYVHELVSGSFVGEYRLDTCVVEVTSQSIEKRDGEILFGWEFIGSPCSAGSDEQRRSFRKDADGNILWRPPDPLTLPDTSAFLADNPGWTAAEFQAYGPCQVE